MQSILNFLLCIAKGIADGLQKFNDQQQQNDFLRADRERLIRENHQLTLKIQALSAPKPPQDAKKGFVKFGEPDQKNPHKMPPPSIPTAEVPRAG